MDYIVAATLHEPCNPISFSIRLKSLLKAQAAMTFGFELESQHTRPLLVNQQRPYVNRLHVLGIIDMYVNLCSVTAQQTAMCACWFALCSTRRMHAGSIAKIHCRAL